MEGGLTFSVLFVCDYLVLGFGQNANNNSSCGGGGCVNNSNAYANILQPKAAGARQTCLCVRACALTMCLHF